MSKKTDRDFSIGVARVQKRIVAVTPWHNPMFKMILNNDWLIENFKGKAADRILSVLFLG